VPDRAGCNNFWSAAYSRKTGLLTSRARSCATVTSAISAASCAASRRRRLRHDGRLTSGLVVPRFPPPAISSTQKHALSDSSGCWRLPVGIVVTALLDAPSWPRTQRSRNCGRSMSAPAYRRPAPCLRLSTAAIHRGLHRPHPQPGVQARQRHRDEGLAKIAQP